MGWLSVVFVPALQIVVAFVLIRRLARRWWDYVIVLALAAVLFRPLYELATGDMSRILPVFPWSDGADGKDQIILVSIASTFLLPLIASALAVLLAKRIVTSLR